MVLLGIPLSLAQSHISEKEIFMMSAINYLQTIEALFFHFEKAVAEIFCKSQVIFIAAKIINY